MVRKKIIFVIGALAAIAASAQDAEHQRLGVESLQAWSAQLETGASVSHSNIGNTDLLSVDYDISASFTLAQTWTISGWLPIGSAITVGDGVTSPFASGLGDCGLSFAWAGRLGDARTVIMSQCTIPTGAVVADSPSELALGSGRWSATLSGALSLITDPVVLGGSLSYKVRFPLQERFGSSWFPVELGLVLNATELLNDTVGYTLSISQSLRLPELYEGIPIYDSFAYRANAAFEFFYSGRNFAITFGCSKDVTDNSSPIIISCSLTYLIKPKEKEAFGAAR